MDTSIQGAAIGDWQPEHTAPRDGTIVLIVRAGMDARPFTGYVNENGDWESHEEYFLREGRPTHWMRLPKPPIDMAISPYSEADDDKIFALTCARKNARTDADAASIAWAEEEIETLRRERDDAVRALNAKDRAASTVARGVDLGVKLCPHCEGAGTFDDRASGGEIECTWCSGTGDYREPSAAPLPPSL